MTRITIISYCHENHKGWVSSWAEQVNKQTFRDFNILFIPHNWGEKGEGLKQASENAKFVFDSVTDKLDPDLLDRLRVLSYWSEPVIGEVIDFACRNVTTEFIAHHDVDDIIHPKRLELQSAYLNRNPDVDFLGTRMVGFHGEPPPEMLELDYLEPNEPYAGVCDDKALRAIMLLLLDGSGQNCMGHTTMIYRPEALQDIGGFSRSDVKKDKKSPDFETWRKAMMAGYKFHRLPQLCALWRMDSSSIRFD